MLQFEADIEMVFDRAFPAASDNNDVLDSGMKGFLDSVLDQWLIDQRKHFFGLGLGGWKKAGTEPSGREDGFANLCAHQLFILPVGG